MGFGTTFCDVVACGWSIGFADGTNSPPLIPVIRFLPALTCGLSYYLSMKRPGIPMDRIQMLKANYEEKLGYAREEDRERASLFIRPKLGYI